VLRLIAAPDPVDPVDFASRIEPLLAGASGALAVAVSGGVDSVALLHLCDGWARSRGRDLTVYTVDHGLRPDAAAEAKGVGRLAASLGRRHRILTWDGPKPVTGLQAAAREARYRLLAGACHRDGSEALALAHHLDDQAETLLHRIERGTGPDGLAGIPATRRVDGVTLVRPLLDLPKERLVATCRAAGLTWAEDPSNLDPRFARTRYRALAGALAASGVTAERLGRLASAMTTARCALDRHCADWMAAHATLTPAGTVTLARPALLDAPALLRRRLVGRALRAAGGSGYPARGERLDRLLAWIEEEGAGTGIRTLAGCRLERSAGAVSVLRDWRQAARPAVVEPRGRLRWDGRFEIHNPTDAPVRVGVCGEEGWRRWRRTAGVGGLPAAPALAHAARLALPAVVDLDGGIALPHLVESAPAPFGWVGEMVRVRFCPDLPFP